MYELAKPSQLRAAPPLRDAGLPGVTPSFWAGRFGITCAGSGSAKPAAAGMPGAGKNTRCTASAFTHTYMGHTYR